MGNIVQLWQLTSQETDVGDVRTRERAAVRGVLQSVHTLVTGLGWAAPAAVAAPSTWPDNVPLQTIQAWETWYDQTATPATLPPSSVLERNTPQASGTWSADLALARDRNAPRAVTAYLSVQGTLWETMRNAFANHPLGVTAREALANAERALESWWFTRLGGATGTLQPFPEPQGAGANTAAPGRTPVQGGSGSGFLKAAAVVAALVVAAKALKRGR